ncbi:phosphate:acyl-[acyl carrier protein] acyltransferase [Halopseudomonas salegens]|uniref:Phosphate acyltransferase n=2 Tax=Halopseudomonas salegens TaxID=1434072 RepID=A0A1H2EZC0_9GAMM|nr:phosphate:acyl-[acyl carrier protein] acyltransferase [Halopseudomonas salegens]
MGGDFGPRCIVPAIARSLSRLPQLDVILVGAEPALQSALAACPLPAERVSFRYTSEVILADDPPASVLRRKTDASMRVALELVRDGQAAGCLSAGNTGALMVLSRSILGTLPGVDRPAFMAALPVAGKACYLLDLGANVDCTADQLFTFAIMGSVAVSELAGMPAPRVGLLNIGTELHKGSQRVREVAERLHNCPQLNYVGSVEGDGLFRDQADVVVCDGFVGNVVLKASEGLADYLQEEMRRSLDQQPLMRWLAPLLRRVIAPVRERHDPALHNGASLLGLRGVVVKSHGAATERAFAAAIERACLISQAGLPQRIAERLAGSGL